LRFAVILNILLLFSESDLLHDFRIEVAEGLLGETIVLEVLYDLVVDKFSNVGLVTTILKKESVNIGNAVAIVCGPPIMMKFVTFKLLDIGFKDSQVYLSMEKNMSCAIGKCGHCRIGPYYACKDGPVFTYDRIKELPNIWD
jgi:NAD(P)H-flavin reductase